jgi:F-type H+-transporting ATPase subunit a
MFAAVFEKVKMILSTQTPFRAVFAAFFLIAFSAFTAKAQESKPAKFDAGKMIFEHVGDAHEWHILGEGKNSIALPLPVILYTPKGLDVFMSGKFEHGEATFQGKYLYKDEGSSIVALDPSGKVDEAVTAKIIDFSITKNVAALLFSAFLLLWVFLSVAAAYKNNPGKAPKGMQSLFEPLIIFIRDDVAKPTIGPKYEKFLPYLLTIFFFIWFNNMLGIVPIFPGGANLTGNVAITGVLAILTFVITTINGNKNYWHHIFAMPGVPKFVLIILTPIEIMGVFLRPMVLMIRLFANMLAGHIIALSFIALIFIFGEMYVGLGYGVGIFAVLFNTFMGLLELLVALIQAYVFTLLSAMYFGAAVEEPHNHKESIV